MDGFGSRSAPARLRRGLLVEPRRPVAIARSPRAHWYVVETVCVGAFMGQLDASIVSLALPRIGSDLHAGASVVQWVSLSYLLTLLMTLVAAGRLADLAGRKLLYTYGFALFTLGSALCGLAPSLSWLIGARLLQGLGAAFLQANSVALIRQAMPAGELTRGIGVQGAAQAIGLALGPALGGLLLTAGGWRLIFLVNLPIGLGGLVLARLTLPRSREYGARGEPARPAGLLRLPAVRFGLAGGLISYMAMFGALFVLPYYLVAARVPTSLAGLELACLPIALAVLALCAARGRRAIRAAPSRSAALALAGLGLLELALLRDGPGRLIGLALTGAGLGLFIPANNAAVMAAAERSRAGALGGLVNMTRTLGAIAGVSLASLLYSATAGAMRDASRSQSGQGLFWSLVVLAALALTTACALLAEPRARRAGDLHPSEADTH